MNTPTCRRIASMASSRFQLISKRLVKPSLSTPHALKNYKLSLIDQHMNTSYMPIAFFYPNHQHKQQPHNNSNSSTQISSLLEESLSKTLSSYYPFAGRLMDSNLSVECNDMGVSFLEARVRCSMSEILAESDTSAQNIVYPKDLPWNHSPDQPTSLVVAQLSHFDCGGKALSLCMSHTIGDAYTLCQFMNDWSAMARQSSVKLSPQFNGASILPPIDDSSVGSILDSNQENEYCITKSFVFDSDKLSQLKAKATSESGGHYKPTRVEVVNALLNKCAMSANMVSSGSFKPSILLSMVNFRPLLASMDTRNCVGNFITYYPVSTTTEKLMSFPRLVKEIRSTKLQLYEKYKRMNKNELLLATLKEFENIKAFRSGGYINNIDVYASTSLCGFPTHQTDFGWGKPIRVNIAATPFKNYFVLMDNNDMDGIRVSVTLEEQVMSVFQSDPELLQFASTSSS